MESTTPQYHNELNLTWKSGHLAFKRSEHKLIWDHTVYKCIQEVRAHLVNSEWLRIHTTVRIKKRTTSHILNIKNPSWILRSKVKYVLLKMSLTWAKYKLFHKISLCALARCLCCVNDPYSETPFQKGFHFVPQNWSTISKYAATAVS